MRVRPDLRSHLMNTGVSPLHLRHSRLGLTYECPLYPAIRAQGHHMLLLGFVFMPTTKPGVARNRQNPAGSDCVRTSSHPSRR